jgi:hypothetical protein
LIPARLTPPTSEWGKLWFRIFPTSTRTFRTTAKHQRTAVASPDWSEVGVFVLGLRPWAQPNIGPSPRGGLLAWCVAGC